MARAKYNYNDGSIKMQEFTLEVSPDHKVTVSLSEDVVKGLIESIGNAARAYGYWRDNAIRICSQFWKFNESESKSSRDEVLERKGDSYDALYRFGVEKHPAFKDWQNAVLRAAAAKGTDAYEGIKAEADGRIMRIRNVANAMRQRVIQYFDDETSDKAEAAARDKAGARSLIQKFIADMDKRLVSTRNGWVEGDKRLARLAVHALNQVLQQTLIEANPALSLAMPPKAEPRTIGAVDRKAGPVEDKTEEYKEAVSRAEQAALM